MLLSTLQVLPLLTQQPASEVRRQAFTTVQVSRLKPGGQQPARQHSAAGKQAPRVRACAVASTGGASPTPTSPPNGAAAPASWTRTQPCQGHTPSQGRPSAPLSLAILSRPHPARQFPRSQDHLKLHPSWRSSGDAVSGPRSRAAPVAALGMQPRTDGVPRLRHRLQRPVHAWHSAWHPGPSVSVGMHWFISPQQSAGSNAGTEPALTR